MVTRAICALFVVAAVSPASLAQRGGMIAPPHFTPSFAQGSGFGGRFHRSGFGTGWAYLGDPFLYADYPSAPLAYPQPQVIVVQPASAPSTPPERQIDPLLIELQGNRYVKVADENTQAERADFRTAESPTSSADSSKSSAQLPPAVLVFRDGHRESVSDYAIVSGVLYARGNYWRDGYWTKNIRLAALDIPATIRVNQQSGTKFLLPSGPNEVVARP